MATGKTRQDKNRKKEKGLNEDRKGHEEEQYRTRICKRLGSP
jgi:hypothetical protein